MFRLKCNRWGEFCSLLGTDFETNFNESQIAARKSIMENREIRSLIKKLKSSINELREFD